MGGEEICQVALPGFPSVSNKLDDFDSYDFVITSRPVPTTFVLNLARIQKDMSLTVVMTENLIDNAYTFIFNDMTELIGATNLRIGLVNPAVYAVQNHTLVGSTLTVSAFISLPSFILLPYSIIFSISYTPGV